VNPVVHVYFNMPWAGTVFSDQLVGGGLPIGFCDIKQNECAFIYYTGRTRSLCFCVYLKDSGYVVTRSYLNLK